MKTACSRQRWHNSLQDCWNSYRPDPRDFVKAAPAALATSTGIRTGAGPPVYFVAIIGAVAGSIFLQRCVPPPPGNRCGGRSKPSALMRHRRVTCKFGGTIFT
ncbi:MAG: Uncharacterised protein [Halieaceae bacterium]|nr:MAG: Uncharacterised protein [Halieaceae bacterium]